MMLQNLFSKSTITSIFPNQQKYILVINMSANDYPIFLETHSGLSFQTPPASGFPPIYLSISFLSPFFSFLVTDIRATWGQILVSATFSRNTIFLTDRIQFYVFKCHIIADNSTVYMYTSNLNFNVYFSYLIAMLRCLVGPSNAVSPKQSY